MKSIKLALLTWALITSSASFATVFTMGETKKLTTNDYGNGGLLCAQSAQLSQAGTLQSLSFYVRRIGGKLRMGVYDASGANGGPGKKVAETAEIIPAKAGWLSVNVISPVNLAAGKYWLAYLPQSNSLGFFSGNGGTEKHFRYSYGALPAVFSASPSTGSAHWSFYANLNTSTAPAPTPAPEPTPTPTPTPTPQPPPPTGSSACSSTTYNVPGGPDGMGGCFPGPGNVGIPAPTVLTPYTGPCTISVANTVIDSKDMTACDSILIRANNVTISRSKIRDSVHGMEQDGYAFTIIDSVIDGAQINNGGYACVNCGVDGWNTTVIRTEIMHTNRGVYCMKNCTVKDSWIHGTNLDTRQCPQAPYNICPHASALRLEQYSNVVHNSLSCDFTGPFNQDLGCSADVTGYPDFAPIHHNTLDSNLLMANPVGVGFCIYGGGTVGKPYSSSPDNATYVEIKNNVFQRGSNGKCGAYGASTDFISNRTGNVWQNNIWSDGAVVAPE